MNYSQGSSTFVHSASSNDRQTTYRNPSNPHQASMSDRRNSNPFSTPARAPAPVHGSTSSSAYPLNSAEALAAQSAVARSSSSKPKEVRFSPAGQVGYGNSYPTNYGSAGPSPPASRIMSYSATPPTRVSASQSTPITPRYSTTPIQSSMRAPSQKITPKSASRSSSGVKVEPMPLGRGEVAKRLRVNSVLLVFWWLSSRTNLYGYVSFALTRRRTARADAVFL